MPKRRDEKQDLARYVKMAHDYICEEIQSINLFEKVCTLRGIPIDEKVRLVMDFFRKG